ncbi:AAA family ATPase [Candidatus Dactylopiibacterium carminicum]|nr:AAA family ATPase [Candidatus Dactylopiibacterium carminicum]
MTPQTEHFYPGAKRGELLEALLHALSHDEGILMVSGEVGSGKTMLCHMLTNRLPEGTRVIHLANPGLNPQELLVAIARSLDIANQEDKNPLRCIERRLIELHNASLRVIMIIDEAHTMPRDSLEQIRRLSNLEISTQKLLQIVLFGQPELNGVLAERNMRSLHERITQHFHIAPLTAQQIRDYLGFRLHVAGYRGPDLFPEHILPRLARVSRGLTRRVNILADKVLLAAFADNTRRLDTRHLNLAIRDSRYAARTGVWRLPVALLLITGLSVTLVTQFRAPPPAPQPIAENAEAPRLPSVLASKASHDEKAAEPTASNTVIAAASELELVQDWAPVPTALGPLAHARLLDSRADMAGIPDDRWFIQLRSVPASNASSLEDFLASADRALDPAQLRLFVVKNDPKQMIGVIYGAYPDSRSAQNGVQQLPAWLRAAGPFIRSFKSLRLEKTKAADAASS